MAVPQRHRLPDATAPSTERRVSSNHAHLVTSAARAEGDPSSLRGFRFLYLVDAVTLFGLMVAITVVRFGLDWPTYPWTHYVIGFAVATALHMAVYYFGGLYEYEQRLGHRPWLPRAMLLTFMAVGGDATVTLLTGRYLMPRANLVVLAVAASMLISFNRWAARRGRLLRTGRPRMLLVGTPSDISSAREHLADAEPDAVVAGCLNDPASILDEADRVGATELLLLSGQPLDAIYPEPLGELEFRRISVFRRITPADTLLGLQRSRQIGGMPFVALRAHALPICRLRFKRFARYCVPAAAGVIRAASSQQPLPRT